MSPLLLAGLCGLIGGALAALACVFLLLNRLGKSDVITISKGSGTEFYKDVEILEHGFAPQGIYVRYRNRGAKPIEVAHFKVRGFKDGRLWAESETSAYAETSPGQEQEAILELRHCGPDGGMRSFDLTGCTVKVDFVYGYVHKETPS